MAQHPFLVLAVIASALGLGGCLSRTAPVTPAASVPTASPPGDIPSISIPAQGQRVRSIIASRAQARGTTVASNTPQGVVLERALPQSPEALEAQCGPHRPGRLIRVVLSTQDSAGSTTVSERRFIVDGGEVCPVQLSEEEVAQANAGLREIRTQVLGAPAPQAGAAPIAPATPRT